MMLADHRDVTMCVDRRPEDLVWRCNYVRRHSLVDLLSQGLEVDKSSTDGDTEHFLGGVLLAREWGRVCTSLGSLFVI